MNQDEQTYHLINDYLAGKLKGVHLDKFKNDMKNDPEFAKRVYVQQQTIEAIKIHRKEQLKTILQESSKTVYIKNEWGKKWTLASASVIVFFISLFAIVKFILPTNLEQPIATEKTQTPKANDDITMDPVPITEPVVEKNTPFESQISEDEDPTLEGLAFDDTEENLKPDSLYDTMENSNKAIASLPPSNADLIEDDILVEKLISTKSFVVQDVSLSFDESQTESKRKKLSLKGTKSEVSSSTDSSLITEKAGSKSIKVEFWESPINFKGYSYQTLSGLKLYGFNLDGKIQFKELDGRLYLFFNSKIFHISPTKIDDHKKLTPVTQPDLLNILND
jgi:hypothetical protein